MEIWKDIPGYEGLYQASDLGRVRSLDKASINGIAGRRGRIIKPSPSGIGYLKYCLCKNGKTKQINAHRLIASVFLGIKNENMTVDHINGDKTDNRLSNLEVVTILKNINRYFSGAAKEGKKVGVDYVKNENTWIARGCKDKKRICLGRFKDKERAIAAREEWEASVGLR